MRLVTGGLMHETHSFSAEATPMEAWSMYRGDEGRRYAGTNHSLGGVIDACQRLDIDLAPTYFASATPSGPTDRATFLAHLAALRDGIATALPADGIVLTLHGAMVAGDTPDPERELLEAVREVAGPDLPIAVTLDLHANTSREMAELATVIVGYDTYPHIDLNQRAQEAVGLLARTIRGEIRPATGFAKPPLMPVPQAMFTAAAPFRDLFAHIFALEEAAGSPVLSITLAGGFPYSDSITTGMSVIVHTDNDPGAAQRIADEIAHLAWDRRHEMVIANTPVPEAVAAAIAYPEEPVFLVDVGDNIGGGTPGDGTVILAGLLRQRAQGAVIVIADADAAQAAHEAGAGGAFEGTVGGRTDRLHGEPVPIRGTVRSLSDGRWVHEGPENAGVAVESGPTAVIDVDSGGIILVLTSRKVMPGDQQQLRSVGIEPAAQHIIVVKSAVRWRGGYGPIARHAIDCDTPGLGSVNLGGFAFQHIPRPIFPLDPDTTWDPGTP